MADGMDAGRQLLVECGLCQTLGGIPHQCAFLSGTYFDPNNWNCGSMRLLTAKCKDPVVGDEIISYALPAPDGSAVVWHIRVGQPQRVRMAGVVSAAFTAEPLTLKLVEELLRAG